MNNNRWTKESALKRISKSDYKGLSYWSAYDYLLKYHPAELAILKG